MPYTTTTTTKTKTKTKSTTAAKETHPRRAAYALGLLGICAALAGPGIPGVQAQQTQQTQQTEPAPAENHLQLQLQLQHTPADSAAPDTTETIKTTETTEAAPPKKPETPEWRIGFATAQSGWLQPYDTPAKQAAFIRIDEINAAGGLLGRKLRVLEADTRTDMAAAAAAAEQLLRQDIDLLAVSCDYDFGAPAAKLAQQHGKISFFLCAEDIQAGLQGVGSYSFSASVLAPVQGATITEWAYQRRNVRSVYVLLDSMIAYNQGVCDGFDWMAKRLPQLKILGRSTYEDNPTSIAQQVQDIQALPQPPDAIVLCSVIPSAAHMARALREAGIQALLLNGSATDGQYWLDQVPNLSGFALPVQASSYGDDPNPLIEAFNTTYAQRYGQRPGNTYAYPGYIMVDLWAKAVQRAASTDAPAVTAELEKMRDEPTLFGPRTFTPEIHHQNSALLLISEINNGKPGIKDEWRISTPIPLQDLLQRLQAPSPVPQSQPQPSPSSESEPAPESELEPEATTPNDSNSNNASDSDSNTSPASTGNADNADNADNTHPAPSV